MDWIDTDTLGGPEGIWPQWDTIPAAWQAIVLATAQEACAAYAPAARVDAITGPEDCPPAFKWALVLQAQEVWAASKRDGDVIQASGSDIVIRARPLTAAVRAQLRPTQGRRAVG